MQQLRSQSARRSGSGQTMIELVVVIFIILTAIGGIAALVTVSVRGESMTEETVIAYNLAREGVELARAMRDNGFTTEARPATCGSCRVLPIGQTSSDHNGIIALLSISAPFAYFPSLDYDGATSNFTNRGTEVCLRGGGTNSQFYYNYYNSSYAQSCQPDACANVGNACANVTRYRRRIQVDFICYNFSTNVETIAAAGTTGCTAPAQYIGNKITAIVLIYGSGGARKEVKVEDYLYAWK